MKLDDMIEMNESRASKTADKLGLEYFGFGKYGKDGKVTHLVKNGNLVPNRRMSGQYHAPHKMQGLYNADVGDVVEVGVEGSRIKRRMVVSKILPTDRLKMDSGDIFNRDGSLSKAGPNSWKPDSGKRGAKVFAKHKTADEANKELQKRKAEHLRTYNWDKLSHEELDSILNTLPHGIGFGNMKPGDRH